MTFRHRVRVKWDKSEWFSGPGYLGLAPFPLDMSAHFEHLDSNIVYLLMLNHIYAGAGLDPV